jgi:hypothetical protein
MAFNRNHARPLCTDAEYKLFTASLADEIGTLTPVQLRGKIQRARKLRDKYRDLEKRQRLANRARTGTKKGNRPETNARTADKAKLSARRWRVSRRRPPSSRRRRSARHGSRRRRRGSSPARRSARSSPTSAAPSWAGTRPAPAALRPPRASSANRRGSRRAASWRAMSAPARARAISPRPASAARRGAITATEGSAGALRLGAPRPVFTRRARRRSSTPGRPCSRNSGRRPKCLAAARPPGAGFAGEAVPRCRRAACRASG